jgi:hypothetical protein
MITVAIRMDGLAAGTRYTKGAIPPDMQCTII